MIFVLRVHATLVPDDLYEFLSYLIIDFRNNADANRRVLTVAQDILYSTLNSGCKTPKHIGIAIAVHNVAKRRQLLDMLCSQDHALSYDDVCGIESATVCKD